MKIATNEIEHLREEVKNCHRIIKDLQNKREFVGLTDDDDLNNMRYKAKYRYETKLKEKNT